MTCNFTWMLITDYQLRKKKKKILPIVLPPMVEAENFSDHPRITYTAKLIHTRCACLMAAICFTVARAVLLATDSEMWPELIKSCIRNFTGPCTAWADWFTITWSVGRSLPSAPYMTFHGRTADTKADASWTPSPPYKTDLKTKGCDPATLLKY
jgi:hypothetical protein